MAQRKTKKDRNLKELAAEYGVTVAELKALNPQWKQNNRIDNGVLKAGSILIMPTTAPVTTPTEAPVTETPTTTPQVTPTDMYAPAIPAYETFRDVLLSLAGFTGADDAMLRAIYDSSQGYLADGISASLIPDILAGSPNAPAAYKQFLGEFNNIKSLNVGVTSIAEFNAARNSYKQLLSYYGLNDIATNATADKFLMNNVSVDEAASRMQVAFNAVKYADDALKQQLKTYFPSLTDKDIAASILGVGKTVAELQREIGTSGILAESATAGIQSTLNANELYAQGVTRDQARQGYQNVAATKSGYEAAAARAGQDAKTIQTELEKEQLLGLRSQRRAQLAAREQGMFQGQSGTGNPSLGKSTSGQF